MNILSDDEQKLMMQWKDQPIGLFPEIHEIEEYNDIGSFKEVQALNQA